MSRDPKLNDLQLILLSTAAQREDGNLLPLPDSIAADEESACKAFPALLRRKLIEEAPTTDSARLWREVDEQLLGLVLTDAGRNAIAADDSSDDGAAPDEPAPTSPEAAAVTNTSAPAAPSTPRAGTKAESVLTLLRRPEGATLAELVEATGWLPHTTRAALTGLRKKGHFVEKTKRDEVTCYRIGGTA